MSLHNEYSSNSATIEVVNPKHQFPFFIFQSTNEYITSCKSKLAPCGVPIAILAKSSLNNNQGHRTEGEKCLE